MNAALLIFAIGALVAPQASCFSVAASSDPVQRLGEELDHFKALMKTGAPEIKIPVLDTLVEKNIPLQSNTKIFKATGSLKDLEVEGLSTFTVSELKQASGSKKVSLEIEIPSASASTTYDLQGEMKLGFVTVPLDGASLVSATVTGIKAGADLDVTIKTDNSITIDDISNVRYSYSTYKVKVAAMNKVVNALLNKLLPSILESNRSKIVDIIETLGKENINKYFDLIAGKTSVSDVHSHKLTLNAEMVQDIIITKESSEIIREIIYELARSE